MTTLPLLLPSFLLCATGRRRGGGAVRLGYLEEQTEQRSRVVCHFLFILGVVVLSGITEQHKASGHITRSIIISVEAKGEGEREGGG